ncbi:MAG: UDP-3-O-(3-hydroxymyristoyl)glucosamine N-acyltransferase [Opitutaceae bacterium]|nr:UDP-3-O-(3-hydroxymyristoyl)glucosamine N-acyltransferase [Opitutaceae bacterium]
MQISFTPAEIIKLVEPGRTCGATGDQISGIGALTVAGRGEISFLGNPKYRAEVANCRASIILLPLDYEGDPAPGQLHLMVEHPSAALARICARIEQQLWPKPAPGIHPSAVVESGAKVDATATIGPLCVIEQGASVGPGSHLQAQVFIGRNARIGANCWLMPGVTVTAECVLADRVRLHAGVVVGSDGFGYEFVAGRHEKVPQVGMVEIGSDVEIGANSTLDRARFSRTVIGEGTKIDNLVQVAHNVTIGRHCILCAQVGISGSTTLEDYVVLGGQAGVAGHLTLGKGAKSGGAAAITSSVPAGTFVNGVPARSYMLERRLQVLFQRLPDLFKRVAELETQIKLSSA